MLKLLVTLQTLKSDENGASLAEYVLLLVLVALVGVGGLTTLASDINISMVDVSTWLKTTIANNTP